MAWHQTLSERRLVLDNDTPPTAALPLTLQVHLGISREDSYQEIKLSRRFTVHVRAAPRKRYDWKSLAVEETAPGL